MTRVVHVDSRDFDPAVELADAIELLKNGELVAFPTETVYGLGANALDSDAVARIFKAKGRPATNPVIVHVSSIEQARRVTSQWPDVADRLAEAFWPGPLTIVLPRASDVPHNVTAGLETVGVRMPAHPVALALIRGAETPLAAPSANRYTAVSPTSAAHVLRSLEGEIPMVVDAGSTDVGLESTVVSLVGEPRVLRPGMISYSELLPHIPDLEKPRGHEIVEGESAQSPGQARRHYAPEAQVVIAAPETRDMFSSKRVGLIRIGGGPPVVDAFVVDLPAQPRGYARHLYDALHSCDDAGCQFIIVEPPPRNDAWEAIWDRLRRASEQS